MKKLVIACLCSALVLGCQPNWTILSTDELKGVLIPGKVGASKVYIHVIASSECNSTIMLQLDSTVFRLSIESEVDTIIKDDWYGEPLFIRADYDSCLTRPPKVAVRWFGVDIKSSE